MIEEWKPVIGYEWLYEISNLWKIYSLPKKWSWWHNGKIVKLSRSGKWYSNLSLYKELKSISRMVHRLVAIHFIPNPDNLPLVCHKDETLDENGLLYNWEDNLFWWTYSDNMKDMYKKWRWNNFLNGNTFFRWKFWKYHHSSKKVNQYTRDWIFIKTWDSVMDVERELWIKNNQISGCCNWYRPTAKWFKWKYISEDL